MKRIIDHVLSRTGQMLILAIAVFATYAITGDPIAASFGGLVGAVVAVKSAQITNMDAVPSVLNKANIARARLLHLCGVCTAANGDSSTSTYRHFRIRSNDRVVALTIDCDALGGSAAGDIGLYQTAANGGAVVDADFFASAVSLVSALRGTDVLRESGVITVANMEKMVWELLGLTSDPMIEYEVATTLTAASAAAGSINLSASVAGQT